MRVSVAIATYKRSAMVKEAIEAALVQTAPPAEIVVADDASPDDTWSVLTALCARHPQVRALRRDANSGGVENWNYAMRETTGDYIAWCSDDDRHVPDHLEASVAYLASHPEVGLVHSGFVDSLETREGARLEPRPLRFHEPFRVDRGNLIPYLVRFYDWPFHPSTIVIRREVWERVGPFDARFALADTDWYARVAEQFPTVLLPRHGVKNRRHPGNWSNRLGSARMQREILEIVEGSIERIYRERPLARFFWRTTWRWNVRARLLLTLRKRLQSGHAEAAQAAWTMVTRHTGLHAPSWFEQLGSTLVRRLCARLETTRESVSPL